MIRTVVLTLLLLALGALVATPPVWELLEDPDSWHWSDSLEAADEEAAA